MEPISSQLLPTNCRILVLVDVDGDGELKLVTGHADRVVHIHKLEALYNNEPATPVQDEGRPLKGGFDMIADDRGSQIAESSAIVCDHMETHFCNRLRSCNRDRRRSQKIEPCSIFCDRLRSSAIVCDPAIICKPKFCDLRSKCIP